MADKTEAELAAEAKAKAEAEAKAKAEAEAKAKADADAKSKVKVRVLVDGDHGKANEIVKLSASDAKAAVAAGWADDSAAAVAYAEKVAKASAAEDAISE